jgi:hypothetical protein
MVRASLVLCSALLAAPALAGTPDQSNEGPLAGGTTIGVLDSTFSQSAAQSITVGLYGRLDHVDMYVSAGGTLTSPLVLEIRPVIDGVPGDPIIGSRELTPSPIGLQWITFDFSSGAPVDVFQNTRIALVLRSDQDLNQGEYDAEGSRDVYPRGRAFSRTSSGPWNPSDDFDLMFRTFVNQPNSCCNADFNNTTEIGDDDIEAFFACLGGDCCGTCPPNADFNCDGDVGTDEDIASFFRVLAGGYC